jgi:acetoin utilization deacetylase AcuC-like enzyme
VFWPIIKEFKPDLILISAGFDSALGDPLGQIGVSPAGFAYMTWCLRSMAKRCAVILEGGYDLQALRVSSMAVVRTLMISQHSLDEFNDLLKELTGD